MNAVVLLAVIASTAHVNGQKQFRSNLKFGVGSAAYQIEGAWNTSDKGESIWDYLTHNNPNLVFDGSNGDVASDSFNNIDEDIDLLKELGVDFYRFSISWTRLLPNGFANKASTVGLRYYRNLINALVDNNITPMVTLYHYDLPNKLLQMGGWTNPFMVEYFADFARVAFEQYGNVVKQWITFDDPLRVCKGYGSSDDAPVNLKMPGVGDYFCVDTILKAHARAYHIYNDTYRARQKGQVGIAINVPWLQINSTGLEDVEAFKRGMQFEAGIFTHPIITANGDYPDEVRNAVDRRSSDEGYDESRLPVLTQEEVEYIRGTADFLGVNHFTSYMVSDAAAQPIGSPSMEADARINKWFDPSWGSSASSWFKVYPLGLRNAISWASSVNPSMPIFVTANGFSDFGELNDTDRVNYMMTYLEQIHYLLENVPLILSGYTAWNLMDSFEWLEGYVHQFGLYHVNFTDPARPRTIKKSGEYYRDVIKTRLLDPYNTTSRMSIVVNNDFYNINKFLNLPFIV